MWIDPLKHIDLLHPHNGRVIDWSDVTTITVDDRHDKAVTTCLASITKWHRRFLRPAREVIVSGARPDVDGIEWIRAEKFKGNVSSAYSLWCQKELKDHFNTPFVLVWQIDGFALNPDYWTNDFFYYDYTGSPFCFSSELVGNGGFSLRSRKFCEEASELPDLGHVPEDVYFCIHKRLEMAGRGVKFCPLSLAERWGSEMWYDKTRGELGRHELDGCFGFHGRGFWNELSRVISGLAVEERVLENGTRWDGKRLCLPNGKRLPVRDRPMNHVANFDLGGK